MMTALAGRRVLVVGASRGIGASIAQACAHAGASVAVAARTEDRLAGVAKECGETAIAVACDVRNEVQCQEMVDEVVERLGGLDALVYSTGMSIFRLVAGLSLDEWRSVFETNVFGAAVVTRAALPHLEAAQGHAIYLGSESALYEPSPWRGIGAYIASKRALDSVVRSFQLENPSVAFTSYVVGATVTEFGSEDTSIEPFIPDWVDHGYVGPGILEPPDHGEIVTKILAMPRRVLVDHVNVRVRPAPPA
jgi:NAD(P)-dependent dehydrogenase (short-subunit alcohol dehydrogenase family)